MADQKESSASKNIPRLNGSNYASWKAMIKGYFMTLDVWGVVDGTITLPGGPDVAVVAWHMKNQRGMGTILLYCDPVISMSLDSKDTAKDMWDHLATTYGAPMAVSAYTDFLRLMKLRINPTDDLGSKLAEFNMVLGALATQQLAIAEPLQCMILCGAFSDKWGQGPVNILSSVQAKDLKINDVIARLKELSSHRTGQSNLPKLESRIQATSSEPLMNQLSKPPRCQKCRGKHKEEVRIVGERLISANNPSNNNSINNLLAVEAKLVVVVEKEYSQEYDQQYSDQGETGQYDDQYDEGYESYNVEVTALDINSANRFEEFEEEDITPVPVYNPEPVDQPSSSSVTTEYSHDRCHNGTSDSDLGHNRSESSEAQVQLRVDSDISREELLSHDHTSSKTSRHRRRGMKVTLQEFHASVSEHRYPEPVRYVNIPDDYHLDVLGASGFSYSCNDDEFSLYPCDLEGIPSTNLVSKNCMWMLDSGCTHHVTPYRKDFMTYSVINETQFAGTAGSEPVRLKGRGTVVLRLENGKYLTLHEVIHGEFSKRLCSRNQLLKSGYTSTATKRHEVIRTPDGRVVLKAECLSTSRLHWFYGVPVHSSSVLQTVDLGIVTKDDYTLWHNRLGHPGVSVMKNCKRHIKGIPAELIAKPLNSCRGCAQGKLASDPFHPSDKRASAPLALVHGDLLELPNESYYHSRYVLTLLDDFSSFGFCLYLRNKSDTLARFTEWLATVERQCGCMLKTFRSDQGGEFMGNEFRSLLNSKGIVHELSIAHQPQQNGRAEQFNRTILEKAGSIRHYACVPKRFWNFAFDSALHVYNRTPLHWCNWKTPCELFLGKVPDISYFRVFGCLAYVWIPKELRKDKLEPHAEEMIFLGYAVATKGYHFLRGQKVIIARTAKFVEDVFPYCTDERKGNKSDDHDQPVTDQPPDDEDIPTDEQMDNGPDQPMDGRPQSRSQSPEEFNPLRNGDEDQYPGPPDIPPQRAIPRSNQPPSQNVPQKRPMPREFNRRITRPPLRPGNVYGERRHPTEIEREIRDKQDALHNILRRTEEGAERIRNAIHEKRFQDLQSHQDAERIRQETSLPPPSNEDQPSAGPSRFPGALKETSKEEMSFAQILSARVKQAPEQYRDVLRLPKPEQTKWFDAMRDELKSIEERKVWTLVKPPSGRKLVKSRWVFAVKSDGRYKARLVAKGFTQEYGIDFEDTFSPVTRFETVRILLAHAAQNNWEMEAVDVKTAFLYGKLDEEIYMEQPEGFKIKGQEHMVYRLLHSLYGLKQAALSWNKELHQSLLRMGFLRSKVDAGVYFYNSKAGQVIFLVYVDDGLFLGSHKNLLKKKKGEFMKTWESRDLGDVKEYLGIQIRRKRQTREIWLDQIPYVEKVVKRFSMENATSVRTPLPSGYIPEKPPTSYQSTSQLRSRYQSVIGSLLYMALGTRPDIAYSVIRMSQYMSNPTDLHLKQALHIVRYVASTPNLCLHYHGKEPRLYGFADSDWASNKDTRHSTTGFAMYYGNSLISWRSRKQKTIALSSTEAEYMAMCDAARQVKWLDMLFKELSFKMDKTIVYCDNMGARFIAENPVSDGRSKHIDIQWHFVRECVEEGLFVIEYVNTTRQRADGLTKSLTWQKFEQNRSSLGLVTRTN
ncbi:hypothetical protein PISMIDRAFT_14301 [Pisolithus microcarpus 441]|uniref:Integrase catalytic domain-containing protein n=1 Tax=Pisolithus microcarpus 441 TaxID=765257 RepID=A0A0C9YXD4_9AGAM|nr:hypothetical protein PISMIDRAFT_14301 [Pisolithus microcarpus 441]